jgi:hypothetical protein
MGGRCEEEVGIRDGVGWMEEVLGTVRETECAGIWMQMGTWMDGVAKGNMDMKGVAKGPTAGKTWRNSGK